MSSISLRSVWITGVSAILCGCFQISFAQSPGYHTEHSDGTNGRVILVNDSAKAIEAFHTKGSCSDGGPENYYDSLDTPGSLMGGAQGPGGAPLVVLAPGGRMTVLSPPIMPVSDGCAWDVRIDSVLYAGGDYEGDETVAQRLKVRREGTIAAVKFWEEKFNRDDVQTPNPDELLTLAKKLRDADYLRIAGSSCRVTPTPECARQNGKFQVDDFVAACLDLELKNHDPERAYQFFAKSFGNWQKKIEEISLPQN